MSVARAEDTVDAATRWMHSKHSVHSTKLPKKVIVLNWAGDQASLVDSFADFSPPGTEVVFVGQAAHNIPHRRHAVRFREVRRGRLFKAAVFAGN